MKKASIIVNGEWGLQNRLLTNIRDDLGLCYETLKDLFASCGVDLATQDINDPYDSETVIFFDMPDNINFYEDSFLKNSYLILAENKIVKPENWNETVHAKFKLVFTWDSELAKKKGYQWLHANGAGIRFKPFQKNLDEKKKFCTLIAANKKADGKYELYSERVNAITWYENNHPELFDLYGIGWYSYPKLLLFLQKKVHKLQRKSNMLFLTRLEERLQKRLESTKKPLYSVYKGAITSKCEVMAQYKFAICYENAKDIPGYITEKIFDCFKAGCVPVYFGANNINDYIPKECFIDFREFNGNYERLHSYMHSMADKEYLDYLNAIEEYLYSDNAKLFSADSYAKTVVDTVLKS